MSDIEKPKEVKGKSLAPFGDTLHHYLQRLENPVKDRPDTEVIMMKLWEEENRPRSWVSHGLVPIEGIVQGDPFLSGQTERIPLTEEQRQIVSATVQWFATNCGRAFLHKFDIEVEKARSEYSERSFTDRT